MEYHHNNSKSINEILNGDIEKRYFMATKNGKPLLLKNNNKVSETRRNRLLVVQAVDKSDAYLQIADILTYDKVKLDDIVEIQIWVITDKRKYIITK